MTNYRPPQVAGVAGGVGTTTVALALHGRDAELGPTAADVVVCRSAAESLDRAVRIADVLDPSRPLPVLAVTLDGADRRPPERLDELGPGWSAVVLMPYVGRWRGIVDPYREAAGMLGTSREQLPRSLRPFLDAVSRLARAVADSGRLGAPPPRPLSDVPVTGFRPFVPVRAARTPLATPRPITPLRPPIAGPARQAPIAVPAAVAGPVPHLTPVPQALIATPVRHPAPPLRAPEPTTRTATALAPDTAPAVARADPPRPATTPDPINPAPATPDRDSPDPASLGPVTPDPATQDPAFPDPPVSDAALPGSAVLSSALPSPALPSPALPSPAIPSPAIPDPVAHPELRPVRGIRIVAAEPVGDRRAG